MVLKHDNCVKHSFCHGFLPKVTFWSYQCIRTIMHAQLWNSEYCKILQMLYNGSKKLMNTWSYSIRCCCCCCCRCFERRSHRLWGQFFQAIWWRNDKERPTNNLEDSPLRDCMLRTSFLQAKTRRSLDPLEGIFLLFPLFRFYITLSKSRAILLRLPLNLSATTLHLYDFLLCSIYQ